MEVAFLKAIEEDGSSAMLVYADWLEEQGRMLEADAWRRGPWQHSNELWGWFSEVNGHASQGLLPAAAFDALQGESRRMLGKYFRTRSEAYAALVAAIVRLGRVPA